MPRLPVSNNKGPCLPINNNKDVPKTLAKQSPSYYGTIRAPNISDPLIHGLSTLDVRTWKSKQTTRNKDSQTKIANVATKKQNKNNLFIPVTSTESIRSCESKCTNTENDNDKQDGILIRIHAIGCQHFHKNRKIVTKSDSDESKTDEISNAIYENTEKKELGISNSGIKVHISYSLVWFNSSALNSTKQKLTSSPVSSMLDLAKHNS